MANALYDAGREGFLGGDIDWDAHNIKVGLIDAADYTVNLATHDFFNDVAADLTPSGGSDALVAVSGNLANKTKTAGVADANDVTLSSVSGDVSEALVIFRDTTVVSTSNLIAYIDTATGLPVTPNGGDITIAWDNGANRIFKL
jgi:hypothetical protein